ncbi:MAG: D-2-hydroxyacid dehydrogenase [bacterium]
MAEKLKVLIFRSRFPGSCLERIRGEFPDVKVIFAKSRGDYESSVPEADIIFGSPVDREIFLRAKKLKWIQTGGAGIEDLLIPEVVESDVIVTNASGVHGIPISEHVFAMLLYLTRGLGYYMAHHRRNWEKGRERAVSAIVELYGMTMGILGLGVIGREVAKRAKAFGMRVLATKRHVKGFQFEYVDELLTPGEIPKILRESDVVVMALPLTSETRRIIGERELRMMKRSAYIINIGRGGSIDESALVRALREGWIAGAGLDVFEEEPLSPESELHNLENVIVTPHVAGWTPQYDNRLTDIFCENLRRFIEGRGMINLVDKRLGY